MTDPYARGLSPQGILRGIWRWRVVVLVAVALLFLFTVAQQWRPTFPDPSLATPSAQGGHGPPGAVLGTHPAAGDVTLGPTTVDAAGYAHTAMTITNHSSKTSNYLIALVMRTAGGEALHRTNEKVSAVLSGASVDQVAAWPGQSAGMPAGAVVVVTSVDRWAHI